MSSRTVKPLLFGFLAAVAAGALLSACEKKITQPPPLPLAMNVEITALNDIFEADSGRDFFIKGSVVNPQNEPMSGIRVYFSVDPTEMGSITPSNYAITDPLQPNGFDVDVIFVGRQSGVAVIWAKVYSEINPLVVVDADSMHVRVRPPING
jgi:hypothetical protein